MSRYAFLLAPSAVADAPKAAAFLFQALEVIEATALTAFDGARS
ncbi:hypothetical protein [Streptomyces vinaceus]|nr:hypothetical protein [Streptomyces vinaceus]GHE74293.1 hypothetical protein GCM10017778_69750 [Streptomyces vinaceus]